MLTKIVFILDALGAGTAEGRTCRVRIAIFATSSSTTP